MKIVVAHAVAAGALAGGYLLLRAGGGGGLEFPARTPTPIDPATAGTLRGVVRFDGTPPERPRLVMADHCAEISEGAVLDESIIVVNGFVVNAFAYVKSGLEDVVFDYAREPVTIDQRRCMFAPRVVGVRCYQPLYLTNSDPQLHNMHSTSESPGNRFNFSLDLGTVHVLQLTLPEVMVPLRCDLHSWMAGYIGIVDHPFYAVTGGDGAFEFRGLPPGSYGLEVWHEALGRKEAAVVLEAREEEAIEFRFALP